MSTSFFFDGAFGIAFRPTMPLLKVVIYSLIVQALPHCLALEPLETYKAAVVEYHPLGNSLNGAESVLQINVENYEKFIKEAGTNGAEIVVFPEYGLTHTDPSGNRSEMTKYAQIVPQGSLIDNVVTTAPCDLEQVSWVIKRISCSARQNQIYVVINLPEMVLCSVKDDHCPKDGFFIYNSNIAFNRHGDIISKYWKYNLFGEHAMDKPPKAFHSTFSTDFHVTFGMFICFDILWKEPAFDLIESENITDMVFTTAWFSQLPFLSAVQVQASWSYGLGVNLLAADNNNPQKGGGGSGIYSGIKGPLSTYVPSQTGSKLLIATVPKIDRENSKIKTCNETASQHLAVLGHPPRYMELHMKYEDISKYNRSSPFKNGESEAVICSGELCCRFHADVQLHNTSSSYRFAAFSGIRNSSDWHSASFQICSIIHCLGDEFHTCGHIPPSGSLQSLIRSVRISGNFDSSQMVLPNSVNFGLKPIRTELFEFIRDGNETQLISKDHLLNVLSFSIYGRSF